MEETTFAADPMRLMIAAAVGIVILLVLIIKFKLHPVLSMMISAIIIGAGAGMPLTMISDTVEKGVGKTLHPLSLDPNAVMADYTDIRNTPIIHER